MADLQHLVGADLQLGPTGDLATVTGQAETQQRLLHRLLTSPGSYIWQLSYGAGLPGLVGSVASGQQIAAIIRAQTALETSVAAVPEPAVTLERDLLGSVSARISYQDADSSQQQVLSLSIGG